MIGWVEKTANYIANVNSLVAQPVPASLFYREEGLGIHYTESRTPKTVDQMLSGRRSELKYMPFNLFINEKHKLSFRVSDHPLQDGSTISDHVHRELREVTIEGLFTNHPIRKPEGVKEVSFRDDYGTTEIKQTISNTALANFEKLRKLANRKAPVRLVCALEIYPKMIITGLDYERDSKSGSSIRFTMTLREIETVSLKTVDMTYNFQPGDMITANDKMIAAQKNSGKRTAEELRAEEYARQMNKYLDFRSAGGL